MIADLIRLGVHDDGHWRPLDVADAILIALGDRLLPQLRGFTSIHAGWIPTMDDTPTRWEGTVDTPEFLAAGMGIADSPAAAIRAAVDNARG